jgi:hypothetical protein
MSAARQDSRELQAQLPTWAYPSILVVNVIAAVLAIWTVLLHPDPVTGGFLFFGAVAGLLGTLAIYLQPIRKYWFVFLLFSAAAISFFVCYCRNASPEFSILGQQVAQVGPENPAIFTFLFLVAIYSAGFLARPLVQRDFGLEVEEFRGIN